MLPMIAGFAMIFLFIVGVVGLILLFKGIKLLKTNKSSFEAKTLLVIATLGIGFVSYNAIVYNLIFYRTQNEIVGEYQTEDTSIKLLVYDDYTWETLSDSIPFNQTGTWEFGMDEEGDCWSFSSYEHVMYTQTFGANRIVFEKHKLSFLPNKKP
jgi:amino acid transporter